jgi:antitoxin MazE
MKTKIQKWGNSLGVRLSKSITEQKSLRAGLGVSVVLKNDQIVIEPVAEDFSLESMLAEIDTNNLHSETEWSDARGNEVW